MMKEKIKEDDIILCTVKRIEGTTVSLDIEGNGEGSMIFSEVSPGRIRNIRDFVVPNKKVVCKVLRKRNEHIELSLRRVTAKEREEVLDSYKKQKTLINMIKPVLKDKTFQVLEKIKEKYELSDFLDEARENPKLIPNFVSLKEAKELEKIFIKSKKEKDKIVKEKITIKSSLESGLLDIKETLATNKADIRYLGSSKFFILITAKSYKEANSEMESLLNDIKNKAKKNKVIVETKVK